MVQFPGEFPALVSDWRSKKRRKQPEVNENLLVPKTPQRFLQVTKKKRKKRKTYLCFNVSASFLFIYHLYLFVCLFTELSAHSVLAAPAAPCITMLTPLYGLKSFFNASQNIYESKQSYFATATEWRCAMNAAETDL